MLAVAEREGKRAIAGAVAIHDKEQWRKFDDGDV
jgi:hypothetical protein